MLNIEWINGLSETEAHAAFLKTCGALRWAARMTAGRPYRDEAQLVQAVRTIWRDLAADDWREAFAAHPKIGEHPSRTSNTAAWSSGEQAGMAGATDTTRAALADGNRSYEEKFGWIFIVCASGKSTAEMLALLRDRLNNDPAEELHIAAAEQEKITLLRLQKLGPPA